MEDSALFTCILTRMETGDTEAREELRLVIFDKRDLTRVVVAESIDDLMVINAVNNVYSFRIIIIQVLLILMMSVHFYFFQV